MLRAGGAQACQPWAGANPRSTGEAVSENYFDLVERQLAGLCRQGAHHSRWRGPRPSARSVTRVAGVALSVLVVIAVVGLALGLHHGSPRSVHQGPVNSPQTAGASSLEHPAVARQNDRVTAHVIGRDPSMWWTTLVLDKGRRAGVRVNDPVIGDGALVGVVTRVAETASIAKLITDPSYAVSASVQDPAGDTGILVAERGSPHRLLLEHLPPHAGIQVGQQVVTAGLVTAGSRSGPLDAVYPAGIPIGHVSSTTQNELGNHGNVQVTPAANLRNLAVAQILTSTAAHPERRPATAAIDPRVASQLSVFRRPHTRSDELPAASRSELRQVYAGQQPAVDNARRVKAADGQTAYLVPAKGGVCVINTNESLCSPAALLPGAVTVDLCSPTLPQGQLEIEWLLPDRATKVALGMANGTATRFASGYNVYIGRLPISGPQPQTIEWDAQGQHHSVTAGVPSGAQNQTCAHPRRLAAPANGSSSKPTATVKTSTGPGVATVPKP
ncbi:MAG: rod shape-determining protein MreC [Solirubrobacteraceae bacterium]